MYFVLHEQTAPVLLGVGVNKSFQLHAVTLAIILKLKEILFKVCSFWGFLIYPFLFIKIIIVSFFLPFILLLFCCDFPVCKSEFSF